LGTVPGQIGTCTWSGDGCQLSACAKEETRRSTTATEKGVDLRTPKTYQMAIPANNMMAMDWASGSMMFSDLRLNALVKGRAIGTIVVPLNESLG
jgi:hypothetical protein